MFTLKKSQFKEYEIKTHELVELLDELKILNPLLNYINFDTSEMFAALLNEDMQLGEDKKDACTPRIWVLKYHRHYCKRDPQVDIDEHGLRLLAEKLEYRKKMMEDILPSTRLWYFAVAAVKAYHADNNDDYLVIATRVAMGINPPHKQAIPDEQLYEQFLEEISSGRIIRPSAP